MTRDTSEVQTLFFADEFSRFGLLLLRPLPKAYLEKNQNCYRIG